MLLLGPIGSENLTDRPYQGIDLNQRGRRNFVQSSLPETKDSGSDVKMFKISFLGAAGTVTGSRYLIERDGARVLVDCGLFQGYKPLRLRNWAPFPVDPRTIDTVLLTHAHLDHSGYLPLLVRNGFSGKILCTPATRDLCGLLLPDSGFLQEKDADFANRHGYSKHKPALPLYTKLDAERALDRLHPVEFGQFRELAPNLGVTFRRAGHILGAATLEMQIDGKTVVFSGDLGRQTDPVMLPPESLRKADYLIVESTYGDRRHDPHDPEEALAKIIGRTVSRGGTLLVPAFAVGRAQSLLYFLQQLKASHRIPNVPIYLDSPMAVDASDLFCRHSHDHRLSDEECKATCRVAHFVRSVDESKALNGNRMPKIILSASGMATGGRVLHHLKRLAPDHRNTILFAGFQAGGTRGAAMVAGAKEIRIHGEDIAVRAEVENLQMLSAHADADEIIGWLHGLANPPLRTFVTHGEAGASDTLRRRIQHELRWTCDVPEQGQAFDLE